ncbi:MULTISPECIES: rod shape-determining protein MreD [Bacillus]|uniref:Rod shape-determining protein MreD n=2 Tax=Bacillus TaxID=1386 RepID=A0A0M3R9Q6_9BACI|nr:MULTISPECIES: rod shape-determining protein MreD [Bacillus]ALC81852.1 rod shape-determining protein MreD [Bacillus gobiensis]MBP1083162.1 rod shape-determining protein MreD [Bacillus capparidis]MED1097603.1 rod shape-determining protein MreD [Bacillus capparidis]
MRRILLPFLMIFMLISDSLYVEFVRLPFVSEDQMAVPRFLLLALVFMAAYINQRHAVVYGLIFGLLYDINYTQILGVYMFGYAALCYLLSKAFKVLQTNAFVVIVLSVIAVAVLEFYVYGVQLVITPSILSFNAFVIERLLPTLALNCCASILTLFLFKRYFVNYKRRFLDE